MNLNNQVILGLGSNLGNRSNNLEKAIFLIEEKVGTLKAISSFYWSAPWGDPTLRPFLNQVIAISSNLDPNKLLEALEKIEVQLGRKSGKGKFKNRPIDIDILFYGNKIIEQKDLIIPHPGISSRRFVLLPLVEIRPELIHPILKKSSTELLRKCEDKLAVHLWK